MSGIKSTIQKLRVGWLKRGIDAKMVDIGRQLRSPGRVLLLLPANPLVRTEILRDAGLLADAFSSSEICLVSMPDDDVRELARKEGFRSFAPHRPELSWYGFPKRTFFNRMRNLGSELVVDLDVERNCFNAAVSAVSCAPVRVGLFGTWGPPVHNVEIKSSRSRADEESFRLLLNVLSSLRTGAYH